MVNTEEGSFTLQTLYEYFSHSTNIILCSCWFALGFFLTYLVSEEVLKKEVENIKEDTNKVENECFFNSISTLRDHDLDEFSTNYIKNYTSCTVNRDKN